MKAIPTQMRVRGQNQLSVLAENRVIETFKNITVITDHMEGEAVGLILIHMVQS